MSTNDTTAPRTGETMSDLENPYYGKDCPVGMVQVEFVGCSPNARRGDYGWKPAKHAFLEVYVDGKRFRIEVGDFHDGREHRRGLHIITDLDIGFERTSMNAASVFLKTQVATEQGYPTKETTSP